MKNNAIIGQSGGPTAVINASLAGAFAKLKDKVDTFYGMVNGIQGFLDGRVVDLKKNIPDDNALEILKRTPSSYLGSCRFKLPSTDNKNIYEEIFARLEQMQIKYFFYIGGNDSMDTIEKLSRYGASINTDIQFIGIPKTIDNDLAVTDHSPGFGSAAKYIAATVKEVIRDSVVYNNQQVTVIEIMGRNAGWLCASAALAKTDECDGPDIIWLPEIPFDIEYFLQKISSLMEHKSGIVVCVSEGVKDKNDDYICQALARSTKVDSFGHASLGGTAAVLANIVSTRFGCKVRPIELSTLQRCAAHIASATDVNEAFNAGYTAGELALAGETGKVVIFHRVPGEKYIIEYRSAAAKDIANHEKKVPLGWINKDKISINDGIRAYMLPLIEGEMTPIVKDGLPVHLVLKEVTRRK